MVTVNDFESIILSFKHKEIDTLVISHALADYCNKNIDVVKNFVSFKVLRGITQSNEIIKGFINYDNMTASIELDFIDNRYIMKSLNNIY